MRKWIAIVLTMLLSFSMIACSAESSSDSDSKRRSGNDSENVGEVEMNSELEEVLEEAKEKADKEEYLEAMRVLEKYLEDDDAEEAKEKLEEYQELYVEQQIDSAEEAFVNPVVDYANALSIINHAIQNVPDNEELSEAKEYYQGFEPVYLSEMEPYYKTHYFEQFDSEEDVFGTKHQHCVRVATNFQSAEATYDLSAKYNVFKATVYGLGGDGTFSVKIYGDGKQLYADTKISENTRPYDIEFDVTGIMDLKIEIRHDYESGGLAEVYIQRTAK